MTAPGGQGGEAPCETCGGPVVVVEGEPRCVRDDAQQARLAACIKGPGCDERSHGLDCNEVFYTRPTPPEVDPS